MGSDVEQSEVERWVLGRSPESYSGRCGPQKMHLKFLYDSDAFIAAIMTIG
jgi:hypothetical protein